VAPVSVKVKITKPHHEKSRVSAVAAETKEVFPIGRTPRRLFAASRVQGIFRGQPRHTQTTLKIIYQMIRERQACRIVRLRLCDV